VKFILLLAAVILFVATGAGLGPFKFGTIELNLLGFGLACFAGAFLIGERRP
jgi:hypothetical protein